jgi:hypothetical protein
MLKPKEDPDWHSETQSKAGNTREWLMVKLPGSNVRPATLIFSVTNSPTSELGF